MALTIKDFDDITTDEDGHQWSQLCCGHAEQVDEEETMANNVDVGDTKRLWQQRHGN